MNNNDVDMTMDDEGDADSDDEQVRAADPQYAERLIDADSDPQNGERLLDSDDDEDAAAAPAKLHVALGRVKDNRGEPFECSICQHLVEAALGGPGCAHFLCRACVGANVLTRCPTCRCDFPGGAPQPMPVIDMLVSQLRVACREPRCAVSYCLGAGFHAEISHRAECPHVRKPCADCAQEVPNRDMPTHKSASCPARAQQCLVCEEFVAVRDFAAHGNGRTCVGMQPCPFAGCANNNNEHHADDPATRHVDKKQKGESGAAAASSKPAAAAQLYTRADLVLHVAACDHRPVRCTVCEEMMPAKDFTAHQLLRGNIIRHFVLMAEKLAAVPAMIAAAVAAAPVPVAQPAAHHHLLGQKVAVIHLTHIESAGLPVMTETFYDGEDDTVVQITAKTINAQLPASMVQFKMQLNPNGERDRRAVRVPRAARYHVEIVFADTASVRTDANRGFDAARVERPGLAMTLPTGTNKDTLHIGDMPRKIFEHLAVNTSDEFALRVRVSRVL